MTTSLWIPSTDQRWFVSLISLAPDLGVSAPQDGSGSWLMTDGFGDQVG